MTKKVQPSGDNWGLVGNSWAVDFLQQQVQRGTTSQAYLLTGPAGVGKKTLALRLTQALNCPAPVAPGVPCRECTTCRQIENMQFPDLEVVQSGTIGGDLQVESVRGVNSTLLLAPYQGKYRVVIFLRFQEATPSAANALLKTLEEAPGHAILILTADSEEQLLPTVVSRCMVLRLRTSPPSVVESALMDRGASVEDARLLAHLSGGRPGAAIAMLENKDWMKFRIARLEELRVLLASSRVDKFKYADKLSRDKGELRRVLQLWLDYWRDVLVCASGSSVPLVNVDRSEEISSLGGRLGLTSARKQVKGLEIAIAHLDANANARLVLEVLLLDFPGK